MFGWYGNGLGYVSFSINFSTVIALSSRTKTKPILSCARQSDTCEYIPLEELGKCKEKAYEETDTCSHTHTTCYCHNDLIVTCGCVGVCACVHVYVCMCMSE